MGARPGWEDRLRPGAGAGGGDYGGADVVFVAVGSVLGGEACDFGQQLAVLAGEPGRVYEVAVLVDLERDALCRSTPAA